MGYTQDLMGLGVPAALATKLDSFEATTVTASDVTASDDLVVTDDATIGGLLKLDVGTVAAAGASQGNATAIANQLTYVTASDGSKGVKLPAASGSGAVYVIHNSVNANNLLLYPSTGGAINGGSANASVTVAGEETAIVIDAAANTWYGGVAVDF